jgi:hypothetical protein
VRDLTCAGAELACNDDAGDLSSLVQVNLAAGQTIVLVADGGGGPYQLNIAAVAAE